MASSSTGPSVSLFVNDYFERRRPFRGWKPLLIVSQRGGLSAVNTIVSLYIVSAALRCVDTLGNTAPQHYEIEPSSCSDQCPSSLHEQDLPSLTPIFFTWWYYIAYGTLSILLLLDILRYCKVSTAVVDVMLGFHSPQWERWRPCAFGLLLVPFLHLTYGFTLAVSVDACCKWTPKAAAVMNHVSTLAFLLFVTGYFMLFDAHNNGYFLLRIPSMRRNAIEIIRNKVAKQNEDPAPENDEERLLNEDEESISGGSALEVNSADSTQDAESFKSCWERPCGAVRRNGA